MTNQVVDSEQLDFSNKEIKEEECELMKQ